MSYFDAMRRVMPSLSVEDALRLMDVVGEAQEESYGEGYDTGYDNGYSEGVHSGYQTAAEDFNAQ